MTRVIKRVLGLLLALTMALTLLPATALADDGVVTATNAGELAAALGVTPPESGDTVTLSGDLTLSKRINVTGTAVLDLGGHTLTLAVNNNVALAANGGGGNLTIQNGTVTTAEAYTALLASKGTLTLGDRLTVRSTASQSAYSLIQANGGNDSGSPTIVNVNGAEISNTGALSSLISATEMGRVNITGGSIAASLAAAGSFAIGGQKGAAIQITDASVTSDGPGIAVNVISGATATISGGTVINSEGTGVFVGKGSNSASAASYEHATLNVQSGEITAGGFGVSTNGMDGEYAVINLSGGSVTSTRACGVYLPSGALRISGGADITGPAGIVVRGGALTVSETAGTIRATALENETVEVGDAGYPIPAAGIAIDYNPGYGGNRVTINGGTVIGGRALSYTRQGAPADAGPQSGDTVSVSGGAFSTPVDGSLLSGDSKFEARKSGGEYDAPYSYHKTLAEAQSAAGLDGEVIPAGSDGSAAGLAGRVNGLMPAEGGSKVAAAPEKMEAGVYEIKLTGSTGPSTGGAPGPAHWIGAGIAAPAGYTAVAYAAGNYLADRNIRFSDNNGTGELDDIQRGDVMGVAIWLDAAKIGAKGAYYTVRWSAAGMPDYCEVYHFTWSGSLEGVSVSIESVDFQADQDAAVKAIRDDFERVNPAKAAAWSGDAITNTMWVAFRLAGTIRADTEITAVFEKGTQRHTETIIAGENSTGGIAYISFDDQGKAFGPPYEGKYAVEVSLDGGRTAAELSIYKVIVDPNGGNMSGALTYYATRGNAAPTAVPTRSGYTFEGWTESVSDYVITCTAKWASEDQPSATTYTITVANTVNGTVSPSKTTAVAGETITLSITPKSGYYLRSIATTPTCTINGSGNTRTFTMPAGNVTVTAIFAAVSGSSVLTGDVYIAGRPWVGQMLTAEVFNTNNQGTLYYQWYADGAYISGGVSPYLFLTDLEFGKIITCRITSSVQTGSLYGRLWRTVGYYGDYYYPTENPTDNNTGANQGGNTGTDDDFTADAPIFATATNADGTKTITIIQADGSSGLVTQTNYGTVSSASMTFSSSAFANALRGGTVLTIPTTVQSSRSADSAVPVRIVLPQASGSVRVKIPVSKMTAGTVAVVENYFGPDTVLRSSVSQSDGVVFNLTGSAVVKIVDNSRSFLDVSDNAWYANAVKWASSREVMNGVSPQMFDPQGVVNRAMMTQMLYNFDGADHAGVTAQFSDVSSKDWYAASVSWAAAKGIARDYGDRFGAKDALTREDMAAMLYGYARAMGYNPYANGSLSAFSDSGDVSDWARTAMQWAVGANLISGTQNGTRTVVLDPQGSVTRAQLATIMQRFNNMY